MSTNLFIFKLVLFGILFESCFGVTVLRHDNELQFGSFSMWSNCPANSLVNGFEIKADADDRTFNDEEGMTAIRLFCSDENGNQTAMLATDQGRMTGNWRGMNVCPENEHLTGFRIRIEDYRGFFKDDSAANDIEMSCNSNETFHGKGTTDGDWSQWIKCPEEEFICGLKTKVEDTFKGDKLGLIAINFLCCGKGENITTFYDSYDSEYDTFGNSSNSETFEDKFNEIGKDIKNFASKGASEVEDAFNNVKTNIENRFKDEDITTPSLEMGANSTGENINFPQ